MKLEKVAKIVMWESIILLAVAVLVLVITLISYHSSGYIIQG